MESSLTLSAPDSLWKTGWTALPMSMSHWCLSVFLFLTRNYNSKIFLWHQIHYTKYSQPTSTQITPWHNQYKIWFILSIIFTSFNKSNPFKAKARIESQFNIGTFDDRVFVVSSWTSLKIILFCNSLSVKLNRWQVK